MPYISCLYLRMMSQASTLTYFYDSPGLKQVDQFRNFVLYTFDSNLTFLAVGITKSNLVRIRLPNINIDGVSPVGVLTAER